MIIVRPFYAKNSTTRLQMPGDLPTKTDVSLEFTGFSSCSDHRCIMDNHGSKGHPSMRYWYLVERLTWWSDNFLGIRRSTYRTLDTLTSGSKDGGMVIHSCGQAFTLPVYTIQIWFKACFLTREFPDNRRLIPDDWPCQTAGGGEAVIPLTWYIYHHYIVVINKNHTRILSCRKSIVLVIFHFDNSII